MPGDNKTTEQLLHEVSAELVKINTSVKETAEQAQKEIKAFGDVAKETKAKADELLVKQTEVDGRLKDLEQKMARRGGEGDDKPKSLGQSIVDNEEVKAFMTANKGGSSVKVNAAINSGSGSAGVLVEPTRVPGIIPLPSRRMTIRDLLTPGRTNSNSIEYVKELGFTNNAAGVSEGTQKPESNITFELETGKVVTIAHWVQATRQILSDAPMLASYIDGRLRYGLAYKEELMLLKGDGTGSNLLGLVPQATAYSPAFQPEHFSMVDELRLAMLQAVLAEYPATGSVLHPTDWAKIELTKDTTGSYIFANPLNLATPTLWGRPIVETQAMDQGEFLTGAFQLGAQIFDREDASVEISTQDRDNFIKNMVTMLAEERLGLAVYRPEAFITGEFTQAT
ncbi:MAG: phage major capsid protein [Alphaproteobacteria bacterium]|nr:phage major capsid protein [Alphaproteobacteria bacterium]